MQVNIIMQLSQKINWFLPLLLIFSLTDSLKCQNYFPVNKSHLDYLYKEITINGKEMAIVHIYSNAPDYKYIDDEDEGYACVDDAARAAIFYLDYFKAYNDSASLHKYFKLVNFLLYMQSDNGFYYNFVWKDNSINRTFKTSVNEPNWWSWRALWAILEGYDFLVDQKNKNSNEVKGSIVKCIEAIKNIIPKDKNTIEYAGMILPTWLPQKFATDQAALLIIILNDYYKITNDEEILGYLKSLVQGVMMMQIKDSSCIYNGAFLSWQNSWHGWGNSQAYALLVAYQTLKDDKIKESVLLELNNFYDRLIENDFMSFFSVRKQDCKYEILEENQFSQIAYVIRPMVFALMEAYKITGDSVYALKAGKVAQWFNGRNPAKTKMYNPESGIFFDGIENQELVNKNSGAESTIEGLLALLKISLNPIALREFESGVN
jgi:hypothetical protein